jgi:hypothetical protein
LGIPYDILTDGFEGREFAAIPVSDVKTDIDQILRDAIGRTKGNMFRALDIGTGEGMVPLYLSRRFRDIAPRNVSGEFIGTEQPSFWAGMMRPHRIQKHGVDIVHEVPIYSRPGVKVVLTPDPAAIGGTFDMVSWIKPPFLEEASAVPTAAAALPSVLKERGVIIVALADLERTSSFWHLLRPLVQDAGNRGKKLGIRWVSRPLGIGP